MGVPYGRPGPAARRRSLASRSTAASIRSASARAQGPDCPPAAQSLIRRFNPTHADFDPVRALGLVDCGNVRLTPGKILDAFERIEQAVRPHRRGRRDADRPSAATARSPSRSRARSARRHRILSRCISTRTPTPTRYDPNDKYNAATQFTHVAEERPGRCRDSPGTSASAARPTRRASCRARGLGYKRPVARRSDAPRLRADDSRVRRPGGRPAGLSLL